MNHFDYLVKMITRHEGLRLKPYRDSVGKLTIGVGRNLDDVGITEQEAKFMLNHDMWKAIEAAKSSFSWFGTMGEPRQQVVISMIFNLGLKGFKGFKKTIQALENCDYDTASVEMLDSKWSAQVKTRALELAAIMRSGHLPVDALEVLPRGPRYGCSPQDG